MVTGTDLPSDSESDQGRRSAARLSEARLQSFALADAMLAVVPQQSGPEHADRRRQHGAARRRLRCPGPTGSAAFTESRCLPVAVDDAVLRFP